jgi:hypothetical protein
MGIFGALLAVLLAASPVAASAKATMTVTPSTGLAPDQTVNVSFAGVPAGIDVYVIECVSGLTPTKGCDGTTQTFLGNAGSHGTMSSSYAVHRGLLPGVPGNTLLPLFDCASKPSGCYLASYSLQRQRGLGQVSLDFDATIVVPSITIAEPRPWQSHETVHVAVHDLTPGAPVRVDQCAPALGYLCSGAGGSGVAAPDGTFALEMVLADALEAYRIGTADCTIRRQCAITTSVEGSADPIFSPQHAIVVARPGLIPTLDVTPLGTYHDGERVAFSGDHWLPNGTVEQCITAGGSPQCRSDELRFHRLPGGHVTGSIIVRRFPTVFVDGLWHVVDCRKRACTLVGGELGPFSELQAITTIPLAFDASGVQPSPTITVTPNHELPRVAAVHVHGAGFAPGVNVNVLQCVTSVVHVTCDTAVAFGPVTAAHDGTIDTDVTVQRLVPPPSPGPVTDCAAVACAMVATSSARGTVARALSFDGTPLPPPSATVSPSTGLADLQKPVVSVRDIVPNDNVLVSECGPAAAVCRVAGGGAADAAGNVDVGVTVRRVLLAVGAPEVDCARQACFLHVEESSIGSFTTDLPVSFDPSMPRVLARVKVTPSGAAHDGDVITVSGHGFDLDAPIDLFQCRTPMTNTKRCDATNRVFASTDDLGAFSTTFTVHATIAVDVGSFDCTSSAGSCVIAAYTDYDPSQIGFAPLAFG